MNVWSDCEVMWILWPSHLLDYYRVKIWVQSRPTAHSRKARHHRRCMTPQKLPIFRSKFLHILLGLDQLRCFIPQASLPQWLWCWCGKCDTKLCGSTFSSVNSSETIIPTQDEPLQRCRDHLFCSTLHVGHIVDQRSSRAAAALDDIISGFTWL